MRVRRLTGFLIAAIITTVCATGCQQQAPTPGIEGKWIMRSAIGDYTVQGQNHKDTTNFTGTDTFEFNTDGTLKIVEAAGVHTGTWSMTNSKLVIAGTNYVDWAAGWDVTTLTTTDLVIYREQTTNVAITKQKLVLTR